MKCMVQNAFRVRGIKGTCLIEMMDAVRNLYIDISTMSRCFLQAHARN